MLSDQFYYEIGAIPSTTCYDELSMFEASVTHVCEDPSKGIYLVTFGINYHSYSSTTASGCAMSPSDILSGSNLDTQMVD